MYLHYKTNNNNVLKNDNLKREEYPTGDGISSELKEDLARRCTNLNGMSLCRDATLYKVGNLGGNLTLYVVVTQVARGKLC